MLPPTANDSNESKKSLERGKKLNFLNNTPQNTPLNACQYYSNYFLMFNPFLKQNFN
jgi:hypothetical protein